MKCEINPFFPTNVPILNHVIQVACLGRRELYYHCVRYLYSIIHWVGLDMCHGGEDYT